VFRRCGISGMSCVDVHHLMREPILPNRTEAILPKMSYSGISLFHDQ
jgi:hypothetical protein